MLRVSFLNLIKNVNLNIKFQGIQNYCHIVTKLFDQSRRI